MEEVSHYKSLSQPLAIVHFIILDEFTVDR
jgi:hypothetical protein